VEWLQYVFFGVCALFVIGGGLITVASRKPIRSAMGLLGTILGIAGCFLLLSAEFLAVIQLIVYAGAVVILFIFLVMLLGSAATSPSDAGSALPRYVGAGVFLCAAAGALIFIIQAGSKALQTVPPTDDSFGTIERLGREIFTVRIVPFELTGGLLLVAVVGALAVARGTQIDPTRGPAATSEPKALPAPKITLEGESEL